MAHLRLGRRCLRVMHMFDRGGAPWVFVHERAGSPLDDEAVA